MRDLLTAGTRYVATAWFWSLVLLALPNCTLDRSGLGTPPHLIGGAFPHTSAIMCDIEKFQGPSRRCATADDLANGIPLAMAAEALVSGQSSAIGLDFSAAAQVACGAGNAQAIDFQGAFPDGTSVCLNCGAAIPVPNADAAAVCVNRCRDIVENSETPPPDVLAFCTANAHPSTNFPLTGCFDNACSDGGTLRADFADPRRIPQPVVWRDLIGTAAVGSTLTRTAPTTGLHDAGAASTQWIDANDAYVEFEAAENNVPHWAGLAVVPGACSFPCTDSDPSDADINFAIVLNLDGRFYINESGITVPGPDVTGSYGTYVAGERFRVKVKDKFDGTATITYSRIVGACVPGNPCNETVFYTHVGSTASYPFRVGASLREQNAALANVSIVRIQ